MSTLPKGIYKRGNSYYVRYRHAGKWTHRSAGAEIGAALELQATLLDGEPASDAVCLRELFERYLKRLETYGKPRTVSTYRLVAKNLLRFFRQRPVETWTAPDLETYIRQRLDKGIASTTVNAELKNLRATLRLAVEEKMLPELPFKIKMLKEIKRRNSKIFTREELQRLFDAADNRVRALLLISSSTAMRIGEIRYLQWGDIDSAQGKISVRAKDGWTPKTYQERECYVPNEVIEQLMLYRKTLKHNSDSDWVLQNKVTPGKRWNATGKSWGSIQAAFKQAGLYQKGKLTHEIRRAVASTMLLNGTPIHVVKEILGHSTIKTTELYAFTTEEAKRKASTQGIL